MGRLRKKFGELSKPKQRQKLALQLHRDLENYLRQQLLDLGGQTVLGVCHDEQYDFHVLVLDGRYHVDKQAVIAMVKDYLDDPDVRVKVGEISKRFNPKNMRDEEPGLPIFD